MNARIERFSRGCLSILGVLLHPLGRFTGALLDPLRTADRMQRGLVLVLPGIEGESCLNHSIVRGLADGGVPSGIEVVNWTTGRIVLFLYHPSAEGKALYATRLHQVPFRLKMCAAFHFGGHMGSTNRCRSRTSPQWSPRPDTSYAGSPMAIGEAISWNSSTARPHIGWRILPLHGQL